jgi:hypothetical protein
MPDLSARDNKHLADGLYMARRFLDVRLETTSSTIAQRALELARNDIYREECAARTRAGLPKSTLGVNRATDGPDPEPGTEPNQPRERQSDTMKITEDMATDKNLYDLLYELCRKAGMDDDKAVNLAQSLQHTVVRGIMQGGGDVDAIPEE